MTTKTHGGRAMPTPLPSAAIPCAVPDTHDLQGEQITTKSLPPTWLGGSRPKAATGFVNALFGAGAVRLATICSTIIKETVWFASI